jgi:hypothetical protein
MSGRPRRYAYPEAVGEETRNAATDRRSSKRIMSRASDRAQYHGLVYRCRFDRAAGVVVIRRAA